MKVDLDEAEVGDVEILEVVGLDEDLNVIVDEPQGPTGGKAAPPAIPPAVLREEGRRSGWRQALVAMLPALDALETAYREQLSGEAQIAAVRLALRGLWDVYRPHGLERIEGSGLPFDPQVHEAALITATDDSPDGTVLEVLRVGYLLAGEMVRPALVRVSVPLDGSRSRTQIEPIETVNCEPEGK